MKQHIFLAALGIAVLTGLASFGTTTSAKAQAVPTPTTAAPTPSPAASAT